jgi:hypothetical protein
MTVAELIEELRKYPADMVVYIPHTLGDYRSPWNVDFVDKAQKLAEDWKVRFFAKPGVDQSSDEVIVIS